MDRRNGGADRPRADPQKTRPRPGSEILSLGVIATVPVTISLKNDVQTMA